MPRTGKPRPGQSKHRETGDLCPKIRYEYIDRQRLPLRNSNHERSKPQELMPIPGPKEVTEPHKELRFTRSAQGSLFSILAATCAGISLAIILLNLLADELPLAFREPRIPWWWALLPLPGGVLLCRLALRCTRHAYLILTPLGIEIFPFFNPRENMQVLYWSQISKAEVSQLKRLVIHFDDGETSGVVASLTPLLPARRKLLARAITGRMANRTGTSSSPQADSSPAPPGKSD